MKKFGIQKPLNAAVAGAAVAAAAAVAPLPVDAQIPVTDVASVMEETLSYVELASQYATQLQQYETEIQQYQNMVQNIADLPNATWSNIQGIVNNINTVVQQGTSLANAAGNIDQQFGRMFPGYQSFLQSKISTSSYLSNYQTWSTNTLAGLNTSIGTANQLLTTISSDSSRLQSLESQAEGASGNLQAVKASAALASESLVQLQQLKAMLAQNAAAQSQFMAEQESNSAMQQAATTQALSTAWGTGHGKTY